MASTPGFIWWEASTLTTAPPLLADSARDSRDSPVATRRMNQPLLIFQLIHRIESLVILVILVWITNLFWHTVYQLISGILTLTKRRTGQLTGQGKLVEELTDRDLSSEMSFGYDEDFVSPIDEDLQCSICFLALREPVLTRCGHRFCRQCLDRHMARQKSQQQVVNCPVDRQGLAHRKNTCIFPDKATGRKILSLFIRCPNTGCDWTGELREKKNHFDHCKRKPLKCPNVCGSFIARNKMESHVENKCPLTVISCPYALMGCTEKIQRNKVEAHLQSTARLHLALTSSTFKETMEKLDLLRKEVREFKEENTALSEKLEAINSFVTVKVDALVSKVHVHSSELASFNSALNAQIDANKKEWKAFNIVLNSKVDTQAKEVARLTNASPFVWKITGFSDVLKLAINGCTKSVFTEFYTEKQGYKLSLRVDPDGAQTNRNRYLSVYVGIMKGDYDAILPWPFREQVTFRVIDQQPEFAQRKNIVAVVGPNETPGFCYRPTLEQNPKLLGCARLISHKVLKTRRYVEHDTLFLQVEVSRHDSEILFDIL